MANGAFFIGWGRVVPGRERQALQTFHDTTAYWGRLEQQGEIDGFDVALLGLHGGDLHGFMLVRGEHEKLARFVGSEEFGGLMARANYALENVGVVPASTGDEVARNMERYEQLLNEMDR
jgi:hypothetical protein